MINCLSIYLPNYLFYLSFYLTVYLSVNVLNSLTSIYKDILIAVGGVRDYINTLSHTILLTDQYTGSHLVTTTSRYELNPKSV